MQECFGYNIEKLLKIIDGFQIKEIPVSHNSEDDEGETRKEYFLTNKDNIKKISYWHGFGTTITVHYDTGAKNVLYESNVTVNGKIPLRISENTFLSPALKLNSEFIEATPNLIIWLRFNRVNETELLKATQMFKIYEMIEYPGVPTPSKSYGLWGYSSEDLKMDEREIETVLNSIQDELLRKKIECILYARVFKKYR